MTTDLVTKFYQYKILPKCKGKSAEEICQMMIEENQLNNQEYQALKQNNLIFVQGTLNENSYINNRDWRSAMGAQFSYKPLSDPNYELKQTVYNDNNQIDFQIYNNKTNDSHKIVFYLNNIPIIWFNDKTHEQESLIKHNMEEFINNNINEENVLSFFKKYEPEKFVVDLFINQDLTMTQKNKIFQKILNIVGDNTEWWDKSKLKDYLKKTKNALIPDGDFEGDFTQGETGDCIILARICAIMEKPKGKQLLKNLVKTDENGNATVTFKGLNKKVTVSYKEFSDKNNSGLSNGNADVKVLEIAWKKLTKNIGGLNNPFSNYAFDVALLGGSSQGIPDLNTLDPRPHPLSIISNKHDKEKFNNPNRAYVMGLNAFNYLFGLGVKLTTEKGETKKLECAHQYTVVKADDRYVYLKDPQDTSETLKLKWIDYNRLSFILSEIKL